MASWTACRPAKDVFRGFRIAPGEFIENAVEGYFRTVAAQVATTDHALSRGAQILTDKPNRHFFQRRVIVIGVSGAFGRIHGVSESNQSIVLHNIGASRAFHRFGQHGFRGTWIRGEFFQQPSEWRYRKRITFFAGNQSILRI
jgi:hypothetical protein